jgi:hypothetical protein
MGNVLDFLDPAEKRRRYGTLRAKLWKRPQQLR